MAAFAKRGVRVTEAKGRSDFIDTDTTRSTPDARRNYRPRGWAARKAVGPLAGRAGRAPICLVEGVMRVCSVFVFFLVVVRDGAQTGPVVEAPTSRRSRCPVVLAIDASGMVTRAAVAHGLRRSTPQV